jgi:hypothetical protein
MSDRAKRYRRLCADGARQLGVKPSDSRAQHYATLHLARENLTAASIAGKTNFDPGALLRLDESLRAIMPVVAADVPQVNIRVCRRLHGVCEKCGHVQQLDIDVPPPDHERPFRSELRLLPLPSGNGFDNDSH